MEIDFVGPEPDQPEIEITAQGAISVYGWEGSEAIAFKNGRVVGEHRTVEEIIRTELELAKVIHGQTLNLAAKYPPFNTR